MSSIRRVCLSEISELITKGTTPTTLGFEFQNTGINFLKIECFDEYGDFIESKVAHISPECHDQLKRSQLKAGDILFSIAGAIGRVAIVTEDMLPANTNQALAIIRITQNDIYIPYIKLILTSPIVKSQFERKKQGVAQLNISLKDINDIEIPLPDMEHQIECVKEFDLTAGIINNRRHQLSDLDILIKARFVEMFGDPISNSKELPIHKLGEICELQAGDFTSADAIHEIADENNPYPCYGGNGIRGYVDNYTQEGIFPIIGRQGALCGNVQLASGKFRNTEHAVLVTPKTRLNRLWLLELLQLEDLYRFHTGAAQPGLAVKTLNQIAVPVASEEDQNKYADFYSQINKSKSAVQQALNKSQLLFDSLMQKYFG